MTSKAVIVKNPYRIDFANLCGGNDFAALTNNYNRQKIVELIDSIDNYIDKKYVTDAIRITKKIEVCPDDDDDEYFKLLQERNELQNKYVEEKTKSINGIEATAKPQEDKQLHQKHKGYNTTESAVLMYFLNDQHSVNTTNNGEKNCLQKNAQKAYSKTFGWAEKSYEGKINLDFTDPAVRTAMEKVANDYKDVNPKMVEEIWHQYNEYEEDFYKKYPQKIKN